MNNHSFLVCSPLALLLLLGGPTRSAMAVCTEVPPSDSRTGLIQSLLTEILTGIIAIDEGRLLSVASAHFRRLMDGPSLHSFAQQAMLGGYALARVQRLRVMDAPPDGPPDAKGWRKVACGEEPTATNFVSYEARDTLWEVMAVAEGPLLKEPREFGRMVLALAQEGGSWKVVDMTLTRSTFLGLNAFDYIDLLDEQVASGDGWAARESWDRASMLSYSGHRLRTGAQNAAASRKVDLRPEAPPKGTWVETSGGESFPTPVLNIARHSTAIRPELRIDYLSQAPTDPNQVKIEADRWMNWLEEKHQGYLRLFSRVRFAPLSTRIAPAALENAPPEVRTVRMVSESSQGGGR